MSKVIGITGWKNSGKTTLVSKLVKEFDARGFKVSTIKHAHEGFDIDQPDTDTSKHRAAGASEVAIVSNKRWALMHEVKVSGEEPSLASIRRKLAPCDLVIVEGFKDSDIPKIECMRGTQNQEAVWKSRSNIIAVATDEANEDQPITRLALDDVAEIADFITQHIGLGE